MKRHADYSITDFGILDPHPAQLRFIKSQKPSVMYLGGRGSGKTVAGITKTILTCLDPRNAGKSFGLFSPTYRLLIRQHEVELMRQLEAFRDASGFSLLKRHYRSDHRYEFINGAVLYCTSFERVDRCRGMEFAAGVYIDEIEVDSTPFYTFGTIAACVRGLGGSQQRFLTTTPRGMRGVVRKFVEATQAGDPDFHLIISRSHENPYITDAFLERLRSTMSKQVYAQEVEAKVTRASSVVFPEWKRSIHCVPFLFDIGTSYSFGMDPGYSHPHALAIAHIRKQGEQDRDVIFWEYCEDDVPEDKMLSILKYKAKELGRDPELIGSDRALPMFNQKMMRAFTSTRVKTMRTKEEQQVWAGMSRIRSVIDPQEGSPRLYVADSLIKTPGRGIFSCMEQLP